MMFNGYKRIIYSRKRCDYPVNGTGYIIDTWFNLIDGGDEQLSRGKFHNSSRKIKDFINRESSRFRDKIDETTIETYY